MDRVMELFAKHMENFRRELSEMPPEDHQRLQAALESYWSTHKQKAKGIGAAIAEHWEKFMPELLARAQDQATKDKLVEVYRRIVIQSIEEFYNVFDGETRG